jgi:hypothetical protein
LTAQGHEIVPHLRQALATSQNAEVRARLRRAIQRATTVQWLHDLPRAYAQARATGKAVLVFSTIGEPDGLTCLGSNLMRHVTFAEPELVDYLNRHFVLVWHNQSPELYAEGGKQETPSASQAAAYPEGGGGGNVRCYFCSADGRVATYLEGYWQPASFLTEAKSASEICQQLAQAAPSSGAQVVVKHLANRRQELAVRRAGVQRQLQEKLSQGLAGEIDAARIEGPYGLLDRSLEASAALAAKPVQLILSELAARNRFHGAIV